MHSAKRNLIHVASVCPGNVLILVFLITADELFYLMIQVPACFFLGFCEACSGALDNRSEEGWKHLQNKPLSCLFTLLGSV